MYPSMESTQSLLGWCDGLLLSLALAPEQDIRAQWALPAVLRELAARGEPLPEVTIETLAPNHTGTGEAPS